MKSFTKATNRHYLVTDKKYFHQLCAVLIIVSVMPFIAIIIAAISSHSTSNQNPTQSNIADNSTIVAESKSSESPAAQTPSTNTPQPAVESTTPQIPSDLHNISLDTSTQYYVSKIVDGDTIYVSGLNQRVRLIGIDTPETVSPSKPIQCYGPEASNYLKSLLSGHTVVLEADPLVGNTDKYGRYLRYVYLDSVNINYKILYEGYGREASYGNTYKYSSDFTAAEADARSQHRGLWSPSTCNGSL